MNHKLYVARREKRLKQKDVAQKIGIHPVTYQHKESGKTEFTMGEAKLLCKIFGCTLDDLFWEEAKE
ncbi:helix-turn-helix transcriptional regulator [Halalkalibacterium halodurans]|uniref:helix-turn-helix transcriptional regulator n=1 Tax=Halalkalibacterium halodurans TaxID=86665 RepID=UPI0010FF4CC9|nr:helix-turn-helix transcriptional regulator [Halalkalibacterium halodurans]